MSINNGKFTIMSLSLADKNSSAWFPCEIQYITPEFLVESVLLIFLIFCIVIFVVLVFVLCLVCPGVASFSSMFIYDVIVMCRTLLRFTKSLNIKSIICDRIVGRNRG